MEEWVSSGCDYVGRWLEFQMRLSRLPGCVAVVMHRDQIVSERAYGFADLQLGEPLTPRHRFRIASHSKSFTAAGIMKLTRPASCGWTTRLANMCKVCIRGSVK